MFNQLYVAMIFALVVLLPTTILAQTTDELYNESKVDNPHVLNPDDVIGPVGRADDLYAAHDVNLTYDYNGVPVCRPETNPTFNIFTPWENIVDVLDLNP